MVVVPARRCAASRRAANPNVEFLSFEQRSSFCSRPPGAVTAGGQPGSRRCRPGASPYGRRHGCSGHQRLRYPSDLARAIGRDRGTEHGAGPRVTGGSLSPSTRSTIGLSSSCRAGARLSTSALFGSPRRTNSWTTAAPFRPAASVMGILTVNGSSSRWVGSTRSAGGPHPQRVRAQRRRLPAWARALRRIVCARYT
jgi:hypothetical protein